MSLIPQQERPRVLTTNPNVSEVTRQLGELTKAEKTEWGGLLVRDSKTMKIDKIIRGGDHEITMPLPQPRAGESVMGTIHCHPTTNEPSLHDIGTFLSESWDRLSIVLGADKICWILMKHKDTIPLNKMHVEEFKVFFKGKLYTDIAKKWNFLVFSGTPERLTLLAGLRGMGTGTMTLDKLLQSVVAGKLPPGGVVKKSHLAQFRVFEPNWSKEMRQNHGYRYRFSLQDYPY